MYLFILHDLWKSKIIYNTENEESQILFIYNYNTLVLF